MGPAPNRGRGRVRGRPQGRAPRGRARGRRPGAVLALSLALLLFTAGLCWAVVAPPQGATAANAGAANAGAAAVWVTEVDGIDDMLSDLNKGRGQLEKKERSFDWRTALIVLLVIVVLAETIWLLIR